MLFLKLPEVDGKTPCSKAAPKPLQTQLSALVQQCREAQLIEVTSELHFYKPHSKHPAQPNLNSLHSVIFQSQHKMSLEELERSGREKVFLLLLVAESQNMDLIVITL